MRLLASFAFAFALSFTLPSQAAGKAQRPARAPFADVATSGDSGITLTQDKELRMPGTSKARAYLPEGTQLSLTTTIKVRSQGKVYEVELWDGARPESSEEGGFGDTVAVLAVFPQGAKEPTDVAEVKQDRETYLNEKLISLGGDDAFEVYNAHLNAGEDYNITSLFHLRNGRLRRIAEIGTYSASSGKCRDSFRENLHWETQPQANGLPTVVADVETIHAPKDDCPRGKERRTHKREVYRWDAAKDRYVKEAATKK